jgi:hypothetical protein
LPPFVDSYRGEPTSQPAKRRYHAPPASLPRATRRLWMLRFDRDILLDDDGHGQDKILRRYNATASGSF